jgi:hypothetical protein
MACGHDYHPSFHVMNLTMPTPSDTHKHTIAMEIKTSFTFLQGLSFPFLSCPPFWLFHFYDIYHATPSTFFTYLALLYLG